MGWSSVARSFVSDTLHRLAAGSARRERLLGLVDVALMRLIWLAAGALPVDQASAFGDHVGRSFGPRIGRHRHVLDNLAVAFPDRDDDWLQRTAVAIWGEIGRVLAEYPHLPAICDGDAAARFELVSHFDLEPVRRGRPAMIFVAPHQANWNLPAMVGRLGNFPLSVLFRRQRNPQLEAQIGRWRNTMPVGFIDAADGPRRILYELAAGRSVGLQMDHRFEAGEPVPYFGIETPTVTIPARLAVKLGTALVPSRIERLEGARFRITLHEPIRADPAIADPRLAARRMTEQVNAHFERWIRARPEQWICAKRRWPKDAIRRAHARRRAELAAVETVSA
jgi:Kdo2-lipid IVA lauroyltransferase/acyltransferase